MGSLGTILQAPNTHRIAKAEYKANVARTKNTNVLESAKAGFANQMRAVANEAKVSAASKEYNFQMDALSEELRAATGESFNNQLQLAAARGALTAQAGYVGVSGSSVDLMDSMVRLQMEIDEETRANALELHASRGQKQTAQIMAGAYSDMDMTQTFGNYDFSQYIEPKPMKNRLLSLVGAGVATFFGGPGAGLAVTDLAAGNWYAANGNFSAANKAYGEAMTGALGAFQEWGKRGGQSWGASIREGWDKKSKGVNPDDFRFRPDDSYFGDKQGSNSFGLGWFNK